MITHNHHHTVHLDFESKFIGAIALILGYIVSMNKSMTRFFHDKLFSSQVVNNVPTSGVDFFHSPEFTYEIESLVVKGGITLAFALITCIGTTYISFHIKRKLEKKHKNEASKNYSDQKKQ